MSRELLVVLDANAYWTDQLFRACSPWYDVLLLKPRDWREHRRQTGHWRTSPSPVTTSPGIREWQISCPPGWLFHTWPFFQRQLRQRIRGHLLRPFTLVLTFPQYFRGLTDLGADRLVYYNYDDYCDNWPSQADRIPLLEAKAVDAADLTICIAKHRSDILASRFKHKAHAITHIPIGCSPSFFTEPETTALANVPTELAHFSRPVVGYIGALNWRFDYTLLASIASKAPELTFVLGGTAPSENEGDAQWASGLRNTKALSNVHFIGWVAHHALGSYLAAFDVLIMTYSACTFNTNSCPAKLWDYFSSGRPIVANDVVPELRLWSHLLALTNDATTFVQLLRAAVNNSEEQREARSKRLALARTHTWAQLAARVHNALASGTTPFPLKTTAHV